MSSRVMKFVGYAQRGVSLVEVLVTIVVLSVGLMGLAGMHFQGLKNNQSAYFRSQATILAYNAVDAMRANRSSALNEAYDIAIGTLAPSGATIASTDLVSWKGNLLGSLPEGDGAIDCVKATAMCTVTVQWNDSIGVEGSAAQQFSFTTQL